MNPRPTIDASPIQAIHLVESLTRRAPQTYEATSLPEHLIHIMLRGRVHQEMNGRQYDLRAPCIIWYHEDEQVQGHIVGDGLWEFITVNFAAPQLPPPPFDARVRPASRRTITLARDLLAEWQNTKRSPVLRELHCLATLMQLIAAILESTSAADSVSTPTSPHAELWWRLETIARRDLSKPLTLSDLEKLSGKARATIARASHAAVNMPPLKRIKRLRLSFARGLVQGSTLSIKEIAARVGYTRVHELSRDYRQAFQKSPRQDRQQGREL